MRIQYIIYINLVVCRCMAVDRDCASILFTCILFFDLLASCGHSSSPSFFPCAGFGLLLGFFGPPWTTLGRLRMPWMSPWVAQGHLIGFQQSRSSISEQMVSSTMPAHKNGLPELFHGFLGFPQSARSATFLATPDPPSLAPEARMTVVKHSLSNKDQPQAAVRLKGPALQGFVDFVKDVLQV